MTARPNTVAFSAGAVCCPDEASARRHRDRATWWQSVHIDHHERDGQWIGCTYRLPMRRWTR